MRSPTLFAAAVGLLQCPQAGTPPSTPSLSPHRCMVDSLGGDSLASLAWALANTRTGEGERAAAVAAAAARAYNVSSTAADAAGFLRVWSAIVARAEVLLAVDEAVITDERRGEGTSSLDGGRVATPPQQQQQRPHRPHLPRLRAHHLATLCWSATQTSIPGAAGLTERALARLGARPADFSVKATAQLLWAAVVQGVLLPRVSLPPLYGEGVVTPLFEEDEAAGQTTPRGRGRARGRAAAASATALGEGGGSLSAAPTTSADDLRRSRLVDCVLSALDHIVELVQLVAAGDSDAAAAPFASASFARTTTSSPSAPLTPPAAPFPHWLPKADVEAARLLLAATSFTPHASSGSQLPVHAAGGRPRTTTSSSSSSSALQPLPPGAVKLQTQLYSGLLGALLDASSVVGSSIRINGITRDGEGGGGAVAASPGLRLATAAFAPPPTPRTLSGGVDAGGLDLPTFPSLVHAWRTTSVASGATVSAIHAEVAAVLASCGVVCRVEHPAALPPPFTPSSSSAAAETTETAVPGSSAVAAAPCGLSVDVWISPAEVDRQTALQQQPTQLQQGDGGSAPTHPGNSGGSVGGSSDASGAATPTSGIAIEVDGPSHFLGQQSHRPFFLGDSSSSGGGGGGRGIGRSDHSALVAVPTLKTLAKRRWLAALGYRVVVVNWVEWAGAPSSQERAELLAGKGVPIPDKYLAY